MHLKQQGAFVSRVLSFEDCEFELVDGVMDPRLRRVYDRAAAHWDKLRVELKEAFDAGESVGLAARALDELDSQTGSQDSDERSVTVSQSIFGQNAVNQNRA